MGNTKESNNTQSQANNEPASRESEGAHKSSLKTNTLADLETNYINQAKLLREAMKKEVSGIGLLIDLIEPQISEDSRYKSIAQAASLGATLGSAVSRATSPVGREVTSGIGATVGGIAGYDYVWSREQYLADKLPIPVGTNSLPMLQQEYNRLSKWGAYGELYGITSNKYSDYLGDRQRLVAVLMQQYGSQPAPFVRLPMPGPSISMPISTAEGYDEYIRGNVLPFSPLNILPNLTSQATTGSSSYPFSHDSLLDLFSQPTKPWLFTNSLPLLPNPPVANNGTDLPSPPSTRTPRPISLSPRDSNYLDMGGFTFPDSPDSTSMSPAEQAFLDKLTQQAALEAANMLPDDWHERLNTFVPSEPAQDANAGTLPRA